MSTTKTHDDSPPDPFPRIFFEHLERWNRLSHTALSEERLGTLAEVCLPDWYHPTTVPVRVPEEVAGRAKAMGLRVLSQGMGRVTVACPPDSLLRVRIIERLTDEPSVEPDAADEPPPPARADPEGGTARTLPRYRLDVTVEPLTAEQLGFGPDIHWLRGRVHGAYHAADRIRPTGSLGFIVLRTRWGLMAASELDRPRFQADVGRLQRDGEPVLPWRSGYLDRWFGGVRASFVDVAQADDDRELDGLAAALPPELTDDVLELQVPVFFRPDGREGFLYATGRGHSIWLP